MYHINFNAEILEALSSSPPPEMNTQFANNGCTTSTTGHHISNVSTATLNSTIQPPQGM